MEPVVKAGIVGFGMSAQVFHAPFLSTLPGYELAAFVERRQAASRQRYPHTKLYRSLEELLADSDIDLVVITTPNDTHFTYAMQALEAGKHVVLEKPFANSSAEAMALVQAAQQSKGVLSVYHNRRYVSDFLTIEQIVAQHLLGQVHEYECHFDRYRPEAKPQAWREEPLPGSGILYDLGSHLIDQALYLFGLPKSVTADIRMQRPHARIDDCFDLRLDFGFTKAILCSSMLVREMGPRYMIHGTLGSYIKSGDDPQEALLKEGMLPNGPDWGLEPAGIEGMLHTEIEGSQVRKPLASLPGNFGYYYANLYQTLINGQPLREHPAHGYNTIKIIELALQSHAEQRTIACQELLEQPYPRNPLTPLAL